MRMAFSSNPISLANPRLVRGLISIKRFPVWEQLPTVSINDLYKTDKHCTSLHRQTGKRGKRGNIFLRMENGSSECLIWIIYLVVCAPMFMTAMFVCHLEPCARFGSGCSEMILSQCCKWSPACLPHERLVIRFRNEILMIVLPSSSAAITAANITTGTRPNVQTGLPAKKKELLLLETNLQPAKGEGG